PNLESLPPEVRQRLRNFGGAGGGMGAQGAGGLEELSGGTSSLRFSDAGGPASRANGGLETDSSPESASASSSFLLSGTVGEAAGPLQNPAQIREMIQQYQEAGGQGNGGQVNVPGFGGTGTSQGGAAAGPGDAAGG